MTFFYVLLAFLVGLVVGWFLWGRLRGELSDLRGNLDTTRSERDRLKADANRLSGELEACSRARADLERQSSGTSKGSSGASAGAGGASAGASEAKAGTSPAALVSAPAAVTSPSPVAPKKPVAAASPKSAKGKAAQTGSRKPKAAVSAGKDNLRRLIGIGAVNERRLNEHGITTFAQIAGWTTADIDSVEHYLRFGGRVEREHWVEQAKLLAAGNEKEFARRFPTAGGSGNT